MGLIYDYASNHGQEYYKLGIHIVMHLFLHTYHSYNSNENCARFNMCQYHAYENFKNCMTQFTNPWIWDYGFAMSPSAQAFLSTPSNENKLGICQNEIGGMYMNITRNDNLLSIFTNWSCSNAKEGKEVRYSDRVIFLNTAYYRYTFFFTVTFVNHENLPHNTSYNSHFCWLWYISRMPPTQYSVPT